MQASTTLRTQPWLRMASSNSSTPPLQVRVATAADVPALIPALVRAFDADPVLLFAVRQDERREAAYGLQFRASLDQTLPHGLVLMTDDGKATAMWTPPHKWSLPLLKQITLLPTVVRVAGWRRLRRAFRLLNLIEKSHPPLPHYYLFTIGVDPEFQGKGYASAVMKPVLQRCDDERVGAYLECTNPDNMPVYEHLGFKITGTLDLGKGAPPYWTMWRDPQ